MNNPIRILDPNRLNEIRGRSWLSAVALCMCVGLVSATSQAGTIAYWRFEPGAVDADSSGRANVLNLSSVSSSADIATNAPGTGSASFDGTAWAQTQGVLDLVGYRNLTVEFFAKSAQTTLGMVCEHGPDIAGVAGAFYCDFNENGSSFRITQYGAGFNYEYGTAPVQDGAWHHYAATINNSGATVVFRLYVDGVQLANVTQAEGTSPSAFVSDVFNIGSRNAGALFPFQGQLDEMRISDRELNPASFLLNRYTNVTFGITQSPTNTSVAENTAAMFSVEVSVANAPSEVLEYQWMRDGVDIQGANSRTYVLASARRPGDDGAQFSVRVGASAISVPTVVTSSVATLSVYNFDTNGPVAVSSSAPAAEFLTVVFDEALDPVTAGDATRYTLNGGATVESVTLLSDNRSVVLKVAGLSSPGYTVSFTSIGDVFGNLATGSVAGTNRGMMFADIGSVSLPGYVSAESPGSVTVGATGTDIWGAADGGSFYYTNLTGDFDLRVRVENIAGDVNANTRGGIMVREDTYAGARNIAALTYANAGNWVVTARTTADGATTIPGYPGAGLIPRTSAYPNAWLRLVRAGHVFYTHYSTNGLDWVSLDGGGITPAEPFAGTLQVGVVSSQISVSGSAGSRALFTYSGFQNFVATNGTIVITTQPTNTTVLENRPVTFRVAATMEGGDPSGLRYQWRTNNVDAPGETRPSFTIATPARSLSGMQIRCVVSAGPTIAPVATSVAVLTVTPDTVAPTAKSAFATSFLPNSASVVFDEKVDPATANDSSRYTLDGGFSVNSATLQSDGVTVVLDLTGLNSPQFHITYSGIADAAGNAGNGTIPGSVSGGDLTFVDIQSGSPTVSSVVGYSATGFTVQSSYGDIWGTADSCNFVYQPITNDFDMSVHIPSMSVAAGFGRGGLMARMSLDADSPNLMVGTYRSGFGSYIWTKRIVPGGDTTFATATQNPSFPDVWVRMQRSGSVFHAYSSPDGLQWTQFGTASDLPSTNVWLIGMAFSTCGVGDPVVGTVQWERYGRTVVIPQLRIAKSGANVTISWPADAAGFQLQQANTLGGSPAWSNVTSSPVVVGTELQVVLPATSDAAFYRLSR